jgi:SNF2 family DNA or RNA helicase
LIIKKIYVEPSKDFLEIYQAVITRELVRIKEEKGSITFKEVKNKFPYLTLACSDPSILKEKFDASWSFDLTTRINNWKINKNPKLTIVNDLLAEHKGEKIIIWSTHPVTLDLLGEYYKKYVPIVIHGQTDTGDLSSAEYRDNELTRFRTSKDCNLAIISPLCLGVGVNIPESSIAIHFDRNWSAVVYLQSIGRNHRATSTKDVTQYVLLMDETLELIQDNALDGKVNLNNNLMKKDILSNEEWNKIFSGKSDAFLLFE